MAEKTFHVFVYGTLKKGCHGAKLIGKGITVDNFVMYDGGFPLVMPTDDETSKDLTNAFGRVRGELYEVTEAQMKGLDGYEGYPTHYTRIETQVQLDDGSTELKPWMYVGAEYAKHSIPHRSVVIPDKDGTVEWNY